MTAPLNDGRTNLDALHRAVDEHGDEVRDYLMGVLACQIDPAVWTECLAEAMRGRVSSRPCGQRAVITQDPADVRGYQSGTCVEPKGHRGQHQDAGGVAWIESVR